MKKKIIIFWGFYTNVKTFNLINKIIFDLHVYTNLDRSYYIANYKITDIIKDMDMINYFFFIVVCINTFFYKLIPICMYYSIIQ